MNILYLAHRIPYPPNKGDKLRAFRHIEHLSRRHCVWCACFVDTPADRQFIEPLARCCHDLVAIPIGRVPSVLRGLAGLLAGGTMTESFYRHDAMTDALRVWSERVTFDVVVAFSSSMAQYALRVPAQRRVLDLCDCDSQKWLDYAAASHRPARWLYEAEGHRLAVKERTWLEAFDATLLITEAEAASMRATAPSRNPHVLTNGVALPDVGITSVYNRAACFSLRDRSRGLKPAARVVGFVGVMNYRPNVDAVCWFVDQCWPDVRRAYPDAVFRIVGRSPVRRVRRLSRVSGVEIVGGVKDVGDEVRRFDVSVAPLRIARGLQNKVLEAMAAAKPAVLTTKAAMGINARDGEDYLIADTPDRIAGAVVRLLSDPTERDRVGSNARRFVATDHRWDDVLREFELIVVGAVEREAPRTAVAVDASSPIPTLVATS